MSFLNVINYAQNPVDKLATKTYGLFSNAICIKFCCSLPNDVYLHFCIKTHIVQEPRSLFYCK